jgi:hypothetical protein
MSVSDITVAALTATPGIGYIGLTWTYADPRSGALPNLALDMVEVWASTTNDRSTAAKVAEGITSARHSGVANGVTWYYWIKARDNIGGYGVFHPSSTTAGVSGTEATATQVTLSALSASPGVGQVVLQWVNTDPSSNGLAYLGLAAVEVWAAATNDRAGASKVAEGLTAAVHSGVVNGATWYYWVKPRNRNGTYGSFFPSGSTAGVSSTEGTATQVTLSALTAVANVSQVSLQWAITDPSSTGLGYLGLAAVEVWAASTNDRAGAAKVTEGLTSAVHDGIPEGETRYYWVKPRNRNGTYGSFYPSGTTSGVAGVSRDQVGLLFSGLSNGKIVASVGSNALTVAIKSFAGNDPGASDPDKIFTSFPNATLSTGAYQVRQISGALSLVISSGSTMDIGNGVPFRIWLLLFDDGGTLRLGLIRCTDVNRYAVYPINGTRMSATSEGGAGGADSSGVVYANATISSKPFRIIGYLEWSSGLATAGTWNVAPDIIRMHGVGDKKPGDVVQETIVRNSNTILSNTTTIPDDNTIPQSSEGSSISFWDVPMTATSLVNFIDYEARVSVSHHTGNCHMLGALFRDSEAGAYVADSCKIPAADDIGRLFLHQRFFPDDLSSHTYKIRVGGGAAGTWTVNGVNGGSWLGSVLSTLASVKEMMV